MAEMFRINTRISVRANEWLDNESATTGIPKSVIVLMAIEQYIQQKEAMSNMKNMEQVVEMIEKLQIQVPKSN